MLFGLLGSLGRLGRSFLAGLYDGINPAALLPPVMRDRVIRKKLFLCFFFNFLLIVAVDAVFKALVSLVPETASSVVRGSLSASRILVICILFVGLLIANVLNKWCTDIVSHSYTVIYVGTRAPGPGQAPEAAQQAGVPLEAVVLRVSDMLYSLVLFNIAMLLQGALFLAIFPPHLSYFLELANSCLINSWSCFDLKWNHKNWSFASRVLAFERSKAYFVGFGLPMALLVAMFSWPVSMGVWSGVYPFWLILAVSGNPRPWVVSHTWTNQDGSPIVKFPAIKMAAFITDACIKLFTIKK
jgi:hypothetical protein